jgi:DNA mismatch repair protein MutL
MQWPSCERIARRRRSRQDGRHAQSRLTFSGQDILKQLDFRQGMTIRILPEGLVNRIRAGEVVERPAQVVKELCENAIDAGSHSVRIWISGYGMKSITVEDDGPGIAPADLALAITRHATSKLPDGDLLDIKTLGFRGEALAAIGAVCRLTLKSRQPGPSGGWSITLDNGTKSGVIPCALAPGTRAEATGLFASHPARRKAQASGRAEMAAIRETIRCLALARPDIAFTLDTEGAPPLRFPAVTSIETRAKAVMGPTFYADCIAFSGQGNGMTIAGFVSAPGSGRAQPNQRFIINGRPVKDRILSGALKSVWKDLSRTELPSAIIILTLPPGDVDHNAHAAKAEVRLARQQEIHSFTVGTISEAVGAAPAASGKWLSGKAATAAKPAMPDTDGDWRYRPLGRALGMVGERYAICQAADGLVVVDAHAAHERVVHESLKKALAAGSVESSVLPAAVIIELGEAAAAAVADREDDLARLGLVIHAMDGGSVAVTAVPTLLMGTDAATLAHQVAAALISDPWSDPLRDAMGEVCALLSCHAAIRSGDDPGLDRIGLLLREIEATPAASVCNHGRPTSFRLTMTDLDRLFARG